MVNNPINYSEIYTKLISKDVPQRGEAIGKLYEHFEKCLTRYIQIFYPKNTDILELKDILHTTFIKLMDDKKVLKDGTEVENPVFHSVPKSHFVIKGWLKKHIFNNIRNDSRLHSNSRTDLFDISERGSTITDTVIKEPISNVQGSLNQSDCIQNKIKSYGEKNAFEFSIYIDFKFTSYRQQDLADMNNLGLSNIKKICSKVEKELRELIDPCIES